MHENQNEIAVCNFRDVHFPMKTTHWGAQLCTLTVHLVEQLTYFCDWQYKGQERWKAWTSDTTATCTGRRAGCITGLGSFLLALHSTTETVTTWMWACAGEQLNTLSVLAGLYLHPKLKKKKYFWKSWMVIPWTFISSHFSLAQASRSLAEIPWRSVDGGWV